jgi:hypothetical protein
MDNEPSEYTFSCGHTASWHEEFGCFAPSDPVNQPETS